MGNLAASQGGHGQTNVFLSGNCIERGIERLTGINQKQIWAYLHGTKPRKEQLVRLENGFRNLQADLDAVFISAS